MNKFQCLVFFKTLTWGFGANDVSSYASGLPDQKFSFQFSIYFSLFPVLTSHKFTELSQLPVIYILSSLIHQLKYGSDQR